MDWSNRWFRIQPIKLPQKARAKIKEVWAHLTAIKDCWGIEKKNPILIYQMGKVGSTSVLKTVEALDCKSPVLHLHTLNKQHISEAVKRVKASVSPFVPQHLFVSRLIEKKLAKKRFPCRIITLTRDPIPRAISFVFEDWRKKAPSAKTGESLQPEMMKIALDELLSSSNGISDPTIWFDTEIHEVFGIDVFTKPYDFQKGFEIYQQGSTPLLLIRVEDLDCCLPAALGELLKIEVGKVPILRANRGSRSWYADSLAEFKKSYRTPEENLAKISSTKYARHFYPRNLTDTAIPIIQELTD